MVEDLLESGPEDIGKADLLIDVRRDQSFHAESIPSAVGLPLLELAERIAEAAPNKDSTIILYCNTGVDSLSGARLLAHLGYTNATSLAGGIERWRSQGGATTTDSTLTPEQRTRYARHLRLPNIGEEGQIKLLTSSVVIIGAGGLGSPTALYLVAAGIGRLALIDFDSVELSNLQRQILHGTSRLGEPKVESAAAALGDLNPDVKLDLHPLRLTAANALELLGGHDVIVDGSDDFPTRYLVNDAAMHLDIPVVHGSLLRFDGQATVFEPHDGPCYRCLFPLPPPPELAPSCEDAGVFGAMAGVIGSIQAMETIKAITGVGQSLRGRLLRYGALDHDVAVYSFARDPECPSCSGAPPKLVDYDATCSPVSPA